MPATTPRSSRRRSRSCSASSARSRAEAGAASPLPLMFLAGRRILAAPRAKGREEPSSGDVGSAMKLGIARSTAPSR
eukprot:15007831-Alexandrium_andersonii.AAC.1